MLKLEVGLLVFWMELSWAIRSKLYLSYIAIPVFFYLVSLSARSIKQIPSPIYFLPNAIALTFLITSYLISFGFVQRAKSYRNLSRLSGTPSLYVFLGQLFFSSLIAILQAILLFILIRLLSGIGSFGSFVLFLISSFLFSILYTSLFLLLSLPFKFRPLDFLYIATGVLLLSIFLSHLFFPFPNLPSAIRFFALLNPLTYGLEGINWALGGRSQLPFFHPVLFPLIYLLLSILFIYLLERKGD